MYFTIYFLPFLKWCFFQILDVSSEILPTIIACDRDTKFSWQIRIFNFTFGVVKLSSLVLVLGVSHSPASLSVFRLALKIIWDAIVYTDMRCCEYNVSLSYAVWLLDPEWLMAILFESASCLSHWYLWKQGPFSYKT